MPDLPEKPSFSERLAKLQQERGRSLVPPELPKPERTLKSVPEIDEDLIPQVYEQSDDDLNIDTIIDNIQILDAYRKWIGKEVDETTTRLREGIKVSCPNPTHRDSHPSAWLNADKKTWFCGGCEEGGDVYDLAAIRFQYDRPGYKVGADFHKLRRDMAESYGYHIENHFGQEVIWHEDDTQADETPTPTVPVASPTLGPPLPLNAPTPPPSQAREETIPPEDSTDATVQYLRSEDVDIPEAEEAEYLGINWRAIVPEDTFLYEYMKATSLDDSPEEYHFWHGLIALSHACGRNVYLSDDTNVYGNLMICLLGPTGAGKSRSRKKLDFTLRETMPWKDNGIDCTGVKLINSPASGEALIQELDHIAVDPTDPKSKKFSAIHTPVNGVVDYNEFAALMARIARLGSTLRSTVMQFSDSDGVVSTTSVTRGKVEAYGPFCSITTTTQPRAVRGLLSKEDADSGFLNRWIFVGGIQKEQIIMGGDHSSVHIDLTTACEELTYVHKWSATKRRITFTPEGLAEFEGFIKNYVKPVQNTDNTYLLTRLDLTMKRLCLLFCINEKRDQITPEIVQAVEPLLEYLIRCYSILNSNIGITKITEIGNEIMRTIERLEEKTGRGVTSRELLQRFNHRGYSLTDFDKALTTLSKIYQIEAEPRATGPGRKTVRWRVAK